MVGLSGLLSDMYQPRISVSIYQVLLSSAADGQEVYLVVSMIAAGQRLLQCICNVEIRHSLLF